MRASALLFALFVTIAPLATQAQTSTAAIAPEAAYAGATPPSPAKPLEVSDSDYPLQSLLANEEGRVSLNLIINTEGRPVAAQTLTGSGILRLDDAATKVAAGWQFRPATRNGQAVVGSIKVDLTWKLPLEPVRDYDADRSSLPEGATPPKPITSHAIVAADYPASSIRAGQKGLAILRYLVRADGSVSNVEVAQSAGFDALDKAAVSMIESRWKFTPAVLSNKPIEVRREVAVRFAMDPDMFDRRKMRCFERPVSAQEEILVIGAVVRVSIGTDVIRLNPRYETPVIDRWSFVARNGQATDTLIATKNGLMRPTSPVLFQMTQADPYPSPETDAGCWYFDPRPLGGHAPSSEPSPAPESPVGSNPGPAPKTLSPCEDFRLPPDARVNACSELIERGPLAKREDYYLMREIAYGQKGDSEAAKNDYIMALKEARGSRGSPNDRCWVRAVANLELDLALSECNDAIRTANFLPPRTFFDTRGLLYLRLAQFDKALADFDTALRPISPTARRYVSAHTFFGRGIAKLAMGDTTGGNADIDAAEKLDGTIALRFAAYGIAFTRSIGNVYFVTVIAE